MSSDSERRQVEQVSRELTQLHRRLADERSKEARKVSRMGQVERSITANTSSSMLQSKLREIERINRDIANSKKRQADLSKKIADKEKRKHDHESRLMREQDRERKTFERQQQQQLDRYRRQLSDQLDTIAGSPSSPGPSAPVAHDVFISHASEDKDAFVRPLAEALRARDFNVWYDEFALAVGDSLRRSIDRGLTDSRYGIVVLSSAFFAKNWPQYELDGLVTKEMNSGGKVILPIWHKVSKDEVTSYSPSLADKLALNTAIQSLDEIVDEIAEVLGGDHV